MPIGMKTRSKALKDPVIENFEKKSCMWKRRHLSMGAKITLIKASFSNFLCPMSLFKMPMV